MSDQSKFVLRPLPPVAGKKNNLAALAKAPVLQNFLVAPGDPTLGVLKDLPGVWKGTGFNTIWRPFNQPGQDRFLELNLTEETLEFSDSIGDIPNRGLLQPDIEMHGITYVQKISDSNLNAGIHIEPGIWAVVPPTTNPQEPSTVVRMASIPHGTAIVAQGTSVTVQGGPNIVNNNITPFAIGNPEQLFNFAESNLGIPNAFRSPAAQLAGITQAMVDNPNSVLQGALLGQIIQSTTVLQVSTDPIAPLVGGGTSNTAFLQGNPGAPNAVAATASSIFWIESVQGQGGGPDFLQLQYSQLVLLNFNGLSWPHVSVATLRKVIN